MCSSPEWMFRLVQEKMAKKEEIKEGNNDKKENSRGMVVLPYVIGVSEKLGRIFKGGRSAQP